jgi:hypothetical protein
MRKQDMMKKAIRTILTVRDEGATGQKIEMGWIGATSSGKFEVILLIHKSTNTNRLFG